MMVGQDKDNLLIGCDEISARMRRDFRTCAKILEAKGLLHKEAGQYVLHWPTYLETLRPGWTLARALSTITQTFSAMTISSTTDGKRQKK